MTNKKTIRTISLLDNFFDDTYNTNTIISGLSSDNVFFEFSITDDSKASNTINTYKISGKQLIGSIYNYIMNTANIKYVTLDTNQQISAEKTFTKTIYLKNSENENPLLVANTPLSAVALSANWN